MAQPQPPSHVLDYQYVNLQQFNQLKTDVETNLQQTRQQTFLKPNTGYLFGIVRWFISNGVALPVFQVPLYPLTISVNPNAGDAEEIDLTFSQGLYYNMQDFVTELNGAIKMACDNLSIGTGDQPSVSFNGKLFSITSNNAFRSANRLGFNPRLTRMLHSFRFESGSGNPTDEWNWILLENDLETQFTDSLENIDPIARIVIKARGLPINQELTPLPLNSIGNISDQSESIVTDFKVIMSNGSPYRSFLYNASSTPRWTQMLDITGSTKNLTFELYWLDYRGTETRINLPSESAGDIKGLFKEISQFS